MIAKAGQIDSGVRAIEGTPNKLVYICYILHSEYTAYYFPTYKSIVFSAMQLELPVRRTPSLLASRSKCLCERAANLAKHVLCDYACPRRASESAYRVWGRQQSDIPRPYFANARRDAVRVTIEPAVAARSGIRDDGRVLSLHAWGQSTECDIV